MKHQQEYVRAMMLTGKPALPRLQRHFGRGRWQSRRQVTQPIQYWSAFCSQCAVWKQDILIEIRYVPIIAVDARERTALNATVLPTLMSETTHTKTAVAAIAFAGTWKCGLTYISMF